MRKGVIQSPHEINWKPKKSFIGAAEFHRDAIVLAELSFIKGSAVEAFCCDDCKKAIIDYSGTNKE